MNTNNVIDSAERFKRSSADQKIREMTEEMTSAYEYCTPAVEAAIELLVTGLIKVGYNQTDFTYEDYVLMRESMFSMIMRSRGLFHPLQVVAHSFDSLVNENDDC